MTVLKATRDNIIEAAEVVKKGGLVIYPTETVYGLGCDPLNIQAVRRLLEIKGKRSKPLPVLAASIGDVDKVAFVSSQGERLAARFWPGPLTMVFFKKLSLPDVVTFGLNSVGVRIPCNDVAISLICLSGGLLVGSSANRSGEKPPQNVQAISEELKEMVDMVLDVGYSVEGKPSTVIDLTSDKPRILRDGPIKLPDILDVFIP